ncbi:2-C-methyl-D-erythritol 4-phosphate cytidylyltransferase [Atopococcus tabaci]|uniref:2-C-methyl-D-erythritol 4-phosphate cytidylyltransferase n=1 Tax=Atopococcus tabaci TaxID=269774 RepID=UPI002408F6B3|nr:2-C-methyl-D-erythritol 4-phosphate cytidylyltransferase [Atopococcus tabaci]
MKADYEAIVLAAGSGERMGAAHNKVLLPLDGLPIFAYALKVFLADPYCRHIILVIQEADRVYVERTLLRLKPKREIPLTLTTGGRHRQDSVYAGLKQLQEPEQGLVMVHDAARPFIKQENISELNACATGTGAAVLAVPAKDTIKRVVDGVVQSTLPRPEIWQVQTPQAFHKPLLLAAHEQARKEGYLANEEGELVERMGRKVRVVPGSYENIKITTPEDLVFAEGILEERGGR